MMQIPDAPYIREAEMLGMPPYNEPDYSEPLEALSKARKALDEVSNLIMDAENGLDGTKYELDFRDMIYKLDGIDCEIMDEIKKVKGIA